MSRMLLLDDDAAIVRATRRLLERDGHEVVTFESVESAVTAIAMGARPDLIISDYNIDTEASRGGGTGGDFFGWVNAHVPTIPFLFLSSDERCSSHLDAKHQAPVMWLEKPCTAAQLRAQVIVMTGRAAA